MYYEENGSNYWQDLIQIEREGERHLFEKNGVEWLGIAEGISTILNFYHSQGYTSFNIVLLSGPTSEHLDFFRVNLMMISRPGIQPSSFTDAWALPYLLWDGEAIDEPEARKNYEILSFHQVELRNVLSNTELLLELFLFHSLFDNKLMKIFPKLQK
ncbi:MAG: hypothetical protein ACUVTL_04330 [Thermoproteota archaeon]